LARDGACAARIWPGARVAKEQLQSRLAWANHMPDRIRHAVAGFGKRGTSMRTYQAAVALTALFVLAACGQEGSTSGLTGATRTSFVQSATASCTQAAQTGAERAHISAEAVTRYCTCSANTMADRISPDQLQTLNTTVHSNPEQARVTMQPLIDAAATACRSALNN
jgi:hypothetical protein